MTVPNVLSVLRGIGGFAFAWCVATQQWLFAFGILVYAVLSDLLDGPLARRFNLVSSLGARIDHTSDAIFVFCGLSAFASLETSYAPIALAVIQLAAFLEYSFVGLQSESNLKASRLGRYNGILYFVVIAVPTTQLALHLDWIPALWIYVFGWLLGFTSLISLISRLLSYSPTKP